MRHIYVSHPSEPKVHQDVKKLTIKRLSSAEFSASIFSGKIKKIDRCGKTFGDLKAEVNRAMTMASKRAV